MEFTNITDNIIAYNQHLRVLKIEMTKDNMLDLCRKDTYICDYMTKKNQSFSVCIVESMFMRFIDYIDEKHPINLDIVVDEMRNKFPTQSQSFDYWMRFVEWFIRDYNEYYLNDDFWYDGQWSDGDWYKNNEDFDT